MLGLATPTTAALALTKGGERLRFLRGALSVRGTWWLYLLAALAQAGVVFAFWTVQFATGGAPDLDLALGPSVAALAAAQIWVVLGEELGWRGFALPRLLSLYSPRIATLALSAVWAIWHAPMFLVAGSLQSGESPSLFAASIFAWSTLHTLFYRRSHPSVVPNLIFHASANVTLNVANLPGSAASYLLGVYLVLGVVVLALLRPPSDSELAAA